MTEVSGTGGWIPLLITTVIVIIAGFFTYILISTQGKLINIMPLVPPIEDS